MATWPRIRSSSSPPDSGCEVGKQSFTTGCSWPVAARGESPLSSISIRASGFGNADLRAERPLPTRCGPTESSPSRPLHRGDLHGPRPAKCRSAVALRASREQSPLRLQLSQARPARSWHTTVSARLPHRHRPAGCQPSGALLRANANGRAQRSDCTMPIQTLPNCRRASLITVINPASIIARIDGSGTGGA